MTTLMLIPTYNEKDNLPILVADLMMLPDVHVMVLDDQSPDGTGQVADQLAAKYPGRVQPLHRSGPRGLGVSYLEGFHRAIQSDYDFVGQMEQALRNIAAIVHAAGGGVEHIVRLTWYVTDKREYLARSREVGEAYRRVMGRHFPAMTMVVVAGLIEDEALVEIEAVAELGAAR